MTLKNNLVMYNLHNNGRSLYVSHMLKIVLMIIIQGEAPFKSPTNNLLSA